MRVTNLSGHAGHPVWPGLLLVMRRSPSKPSPQELLRQRGLHTPLTDTVDEHVHDLFYPVLPIH